VSAPTRIVGGDRDHWNARHFGIKNFEALRTPDTQYPVDFRERLAHDSSDPAFADLVPRFTGAVNDRGWTLLSSLRTPQVTFTDHPTHLHLVGTAMLSRFLQPAADLLGYTQPEANPSLVAGGRLGGGYEWAATNPRDRGVVTLALDPSSGLVTAIDVMWNGALASDERLSSLSRQAIEH
jgi:hypothetical protein